MEPTGIEKKRQELLQLDERKKKIEAEIADLTETLSAPGMPGKSFS